MTVLPHPQPLSLRTGPPRSTGTHLSGVLRYIARTLGTIKDYGDDLDEVLGVADGPGPHKGTSVRFALGFAWEEWMAARIPGLIWQPGEMGLDGVYGTPDGLDCDLILHEFKTTFKSSKHPLQSQQLWMWQACGYLKMLQAQYGPGHCTVIFHPVYLRGDYQGIDPVYRPESVTFEQQEIDSVWDMVVRNKDHASVKREGE